MLANPSFRAQFLSRLSALCKNEFSEAKFGGVIDDLEKRLTPEVLYRAEITHQNPANELARFKRHIDSFRQQLKNRRKVLQAELQKLKIP